MAGQRIALVTGGNKGIGLEVVRQLAAKDFLVLLTARNPDAGKAAQSNLPGDVRFLTLDVANDASIHEAAAEFKAGYDQLDVLINNAGIYADEGATILSVTREKLVTTFQTNT